jgi:hypothetical protein
MSPNENINKPLRHICSPESLINIIRTGIFAPTFTGDYGADSGLNCFSEETGFISQSFWGQGAVLHLDWKGKVKFVDDTFPLPYPKNELLVFKGWRAFIPIRSKPELTRITGFEIYDQRKLKNIFEEKGYFLSKIPLLREKKYSNWYNKLYETLETQVNSSRELIINREK